MPRQRRVSDHDRIDDHETRLVKIENNMQWMEPQVDDYRTWRQRAWGIGIALTVAWTLLSGLGSTLGTLVHNALVK